MSIHQFYHCEGIKITHLCRLYPTLPLFILTQNKLMFITGAQIGTVSKYVIFSILRKHFSFGFVIVVFSLLHHNHKVQKVHTDKIVKLVQSFHGAIRTNFIVHLAKSTTYVSIINIIDEHFVIFQNKKNHALPT